MSPKNLIALLQKRGVIDGLVAGTHEQFEQGPTRAYIGIDPTAPSMHIGHLLSMNLLRLLKQAGHHPVVVIGGATGMIGDPSFKNAERPLMTKEELFHNVAALQQQITQLFEGDVLIFNNYDWFQKMDFLTFLRDIGKLITVNYMMSKESVKRRLQSGLSYTEFAYQMLQAYDFYYLYQHENVKMQLGGSDQWGNITTGIELIRKKIGGRAFGFTTPLITKEDGQKFGKSEEGNIWLDPALTSPYAFYQYWINISDRDAAMLMKRISLSDIQEIEAKIVQHAQVPHERLLQRALAKEMTCLVHGQEAFERAKTTAAVLFGKTSTPLDVLDKTTFLEALQGIPILPVSVAQLGEMETVIDLITTGTAHKICASRREGQRLMGAGGLYINKQRVVGDSLQQLTWIYNEYLLVKRGKKHFFLIQKHA
ncbi:MAG: tyrosine--tRNA ligase [Cytophagales bacterium]